MSNLQINHQCLMFSFLEHFLYVFEDILGFLGGESSKYFIVEAITSV